MQTINHNPRLRSLTESQSKILSIYTVAGYPALTDTLPVIQELERAGVQLVELGFPFSDPTADGPFIQEVQSQALEHGMTLELLFSQLKELRPKISIPIVLMGYINPVIQFGIERFFAQCAEVGVDGCILPDLPLEEYEGRWKELFSEYALDFIPLVAPTTSRARMEQIANSANSFIYAVSSPGVTGGVLTEKGDLTTYFDNLTTLNKTTPVLLGFGISSKTEVERAFSFAKGAVIGTAFLKGLKSEGISGVRQIVSEFTAVNE